MSGVSVFCPNCGKNFVYDTDSQELPAATGGSASVNLHPINDETEEESAYRKKLYCPYCGKRFSVDFR